jgi:hypothetical protein
MIGSIFLGLFLVLYGCATIQFFHVPAILLGVCALVAGILVLLGDRLWPRR